MEETKCKRCGKCCEDLGTMWVSSKHPIVQAIYLGIPDEYFRDWGRCTMLAKVNGVQTCLLHKYLGKEAKPDVCQEYPEEGEKCFLERKARK